MFKLALDVFVLSGILYMLLRGDAPEIVDLMYVVLGMTVVNWVCIFGLMGTIGYFVFLPIMLIDAVILMYFCHLTLRQTAITVALLFVYNVGFQLLLAGGTA